MKIYKTNYEERLHSTGDYELDELLERAFCEGYEFALEERVFNSRTSKLINDELAKAIGKADYMKMGVTKSDNRDNLSKGRFLLKHSSPLSGHREIDPRKEVIDELINNKAQRKAKIRSGEERPYTNNERKDLLKRSLKSFEK